MTTKNFLITLFFLCFTIGCKKENTFTTYEFADKPVALACENLNSKLYNEALYSFENDILNFYGKDKKSLLMAYSQFIRLSVYGRVNYKNMVSEHTLKVFEALKNDTELWNLENASSHLNYNSALMDCIAVNITNPDLKTTLNALLSTNSMNPKLFGAPLSTNYSLTLSDKYLAAYVAFDLFYAKLFDVDFSKVEKEKQKVDFNITQ
jgi:hypothetical protein